jgi:hypothetical protein
MYGTLREVVHKYLERVEMWCWKRMEKIRWTDLVKNLRMNCLLKHVIEGKIEGSLKVKGRRGRRSKKLLGNLKEERGYSKLKEKNIR